MSRLASGEIPEEADRSAEAGAPKRKSIQSVESGIRLLQVLAEASGSLALREIAVAGRMSKSQTHRYLVSYVNTGLVRQNSGTGHYELGPAALQIGLAALRRCEPVTIASETLTGLCEETGYSGVVVVWGDHGPTIVRLMQGRKQVVMSLQVGSTVPVLGSSAGHTFLAHLAHARSAEAIREAWQVSHTDKPNGWKAELARLEHEVRDAGIATVSGTTIPGLSAASAPVLDSQGDIAAVICLVAHSVDGLTENSYALAALREAGKHASALLGYQPDVETGIA